MSIKAMKQALDALDLALRFHGVTLLSDPPKDALMRVQAKLKEKNA